jgi:IS30 family transposase
MVKVAKLDSVKRGSIQALRESGMSYAQIANHLEIMKDTVFQWVKRAASDPSRPTSSHHIGNKHAKKNFQDNR